ncbi:MAG: DUF4349 domain-containing protein [Spirochaetes bacterium]|jgi:hypothetical protein|nr:DUF4349 domain-containing protein [Spirochaetota bacterium]
MRQIMLLMLLIIISGCAKNSESPTEQFTENKVTDAKMDKSVSPSMDTEEFNSELSKNSRSSSTDEDGLDPAGYNNYYSVEGRMLEYSIELFFESTNLRSSRQKLYDSIAKFGFLQNSDTSLYPNQPSLQINARIKSENFYELLTELRSIGILKKETISVNDLTPDNIYTRIIKNRQETRIKRRSSALLNPSLLPKDHSVRERILQESEDKMDQAEYDLWKLQDRVMWANLSVMVTGPDTGKSVVIPRFSDAFTTLLNGLLEIFYNMITMAPFLVILLLIIIKRKKIWNALMSQHKSDNSKGDSHD